MEKEKYASLLLIQEFKEQYYDAFLTYQYFIQTFSKDMLGNN